MIPELLIVGAVILMAQAPRSVGVVMLLIAGLMYESLSSLPVGITIGSLASAYVAIEMLKRRLLFEQPIAILLLELTGIGTYLAVKTGMVLVLLRGALAPTIITRGVSSAVLYMITLLIFSVAFMLSYYLYHALVSKTQKARLR
ncbi:MAG: hypothetical protein AAB343_00735 [Patescibacteria group bacterium]